MISGIEISPSDRAKCNNCNKNIGKGTPRGIDEKIYNNHSEKSYYCYKCFPERIESEILITKMEFESKIKRLNELKNKLQKSIKQNAKAVVLAELK